MKLDEKNKKAEVITADDQLSLAIGRHGQNVRLAAKLTSWHIDIRSEQEVARKPKEKELLAITGVGSKLAEELIKQGFDTVEKIVSSSIEELMKVAGVGKKTAEKILKSAKELIETKDKVEAKDDVEKRES